MSHLTDHERGPADLPTEVCLNPECTDTTPVAPVGVTEIPGGLGLTFHCGTCPCRWYTPYSFVMAGEVRTS